MPVAHVRVLEGRLAVLDGQVLARAVVAHPEILLAADDELPARGGPAHDVVVGLVLDGVEGTFGDLAEDPLSVEIVEVVHGGETDLLALVLG